MDAGLDSDGRLFQFNFDDFSLLLFTSMGFDGGKEVFFLTGLDSTLFDAIFGTPDSKYAPTF